MASDVEEQIRRYRRIAVATDCPDCGGTGLVPGPPRLAMYSQAVAEPVAYYRVCACEADTVAAPGIVYGGSDHPVMLLQANGWAAWVDRGIIEDIKTLWNHGIATWVSCEGEPVPFGSLRYIGLLDKTQAEEACELLGWVREVTPDAHSETACLLYEGMLTTESTPA